MLWSEEHGAGSLRNCTGHGDLKEMFDKDSRGHPEANNLWPRVPTLDGDMEATSFKRCQASKRPLNDPFDNQRHCSCKVKEHHPSVLESSHQTSLTGLEMVTTELTFV